jgi:hypothetical protein
MKSNQLEKEDLKNYVIRPLVLKRDGYKCTACGIPHKSRVYSNSKKTYVLCDQLIEEWAKAQGKKVFTVYLNIVNTSGYDFSENSNDWVSLCPRHSQIFNQGAIKDFREKFKQDILRVKGDKENVFGFYRNTVLDGLVKNIKELTGIRITINEADNIVQNITNNL